MFSEGLKVNQVRFKDVHNIWDRIRISQESFSNWFVKGISVLLLEPMFHFARLNRWQRFSFTQKLPLRTKSCLAARIIVQIFYHVKPVLLVSWLSSSQLLSFMLWTLISEHSRQFVQSQSYLSIRHTLMPNRSLQKSCLILSVCSLHWKTCHWFESSSHT